VKFGAAAKQRPGKPEEAMALPSRPEARRNTLEHAIKGLAR
jgi:hypothetical protein